MGKPVIPTYSFTAQSVEKVEGDTGTMTEFTFTVTRDSTKGAGTVGYTVTGAEADDFVGGLRPSGTVNFARGEPTQTITILVAGDAVAEGNDTFDVTLSGSRKAVIGVGTASGTTSTTKPSRSSQWMRTAQLASKLPTSIMRYRIT